MKRVLVEAILGIAAFVLVLAVGYASGQVVIGGTDGSLLGLAIAAAAAAPIYGLLLMILAMERDTRRLLARSEAASKHRL